MAKQKKIEPLAPEELAELEARERRAQVKVLEGRAEQLALLNREKRIDLDGKTDKLCYISTALAEFDRGVAAIVTEVKTLPAALTGLCKLTPDQYKAAEGVIDEILTRLSLVEFQLTSSADVDAAASISTAKSQTQAEQRKAAKASKDLKRGGKR